MATANAGHYVLGTEGLALLRRWLVADDDELSRRVSELARFLAAPDSGVLGMHFQVSDLDVAAGYARWSENYDTAANPLIRVEEPVVRALIGRHGAGDTLDAACGTGRHAAYLAEKGHRVIGVDATPAMLEKARARVPNAEFRLGDLTGLPLPDASVDLAVCTLALSHCSELEGPITELGRVLRPGGGVIISDLHPTVLLLGGTGLFFDARGTAGNVRSFHHPVGRWLAAFRAAGLEVIECLEPTIQTEDLALVAAGLLSTAAEAFGAAWLGIPYALVWELRKPA